MPDALEDVFPDSWYQRLSEPVREPPQAIPSAPYEPVVQFPGDATELAEFIPVPDVIRPPDKAIPTGITAFAVKAVTIKWFQAFSDPVWPVEHAVYVQEPIPLTTTFLPGDATELREFIPGPDVIRPIPRVAQEQERTILVPSVFLPGDATQLLTFIQLPDVIYQVNRTPSDLFLFFDPLPISVPEDIFPDKWYQQLSEPARSPPQAIPSAPYEPVAQFAGDATELKEFIQPPADVIIFPVPVGEGGNFQRLLTPQELLDLIPNFGYFQSLSIPVDLRKPLNPAALAQDYIDPAFDVVGVKTNWIESTTGVDGWAEQS
ncbi:hypothetical protein LCGC14_2388400, partial [marine sediment metagenome]